MRRGNRVRLGVVRCEDRLAPATADLKILLSTAPGDARPVPSGVVTQVRPEVYDASPAAAAKAKTQDVAVAKTYAYGLAPDQLPKRAVDRPLLFAQAGDTLRLTAAVVPSAGGDAPAPTGTVRFELRDGVAGVAADAPLLAPPQAADVEWAPLPDGNGLSGPQAAVTLAGMPLRTVTVAAVYSGDATYPAATSVLTLVGRGNNDLRHGGPPVVAATANPPGVYSSTVFASNAYGQTAFAIPAYESDFSGGVRVAVGDVDGDGLPEVITAPGPGRPPEVKVFSGADGRLLRTVMAFEPSFTGGVYVTAGDLSGDGRADIVVSPDNGGGPRVRVFDAAGGPDLADYYAIEDANFRGGVRVSVGDLNGDGRPDLAVGAGVGGGPRLSVWDGTSLRPAAPQRRLTDDFFVFDQGLRNGVYVGTGDLSGGGVADLLVGGGPGGGPRVMAFAGPALAAGRLDVLADFFAGDPADRSGVQVSGVSGWGGLPGGILALPVGSGQPGLFAGGRPVPALNEAFGWAGQAAPVGSAAGWNQASVAAGKSQVPAQVAARTPAATPKLTQPARGGFDAAALQRRLTGTYTSSQFPSKASVPDVFGDQTFTISVSLTMTNVRVDPSVSVANSVGYTFSGTLRVSFADGRKSDISVDVSGGGKIDIGTGRGDLTVSDRGGRLRANFSAATLLTSPAMTIRLGPDSLEYVREGDVSGSATNATTLGREIDLQSGR